jgi:hypothetical protein
VFGSHDAAFDEAGAASAPDDFAAYEAEVAAVRAAVAGASLDEGFTHERFGQISLRWIYTHMIEEYARHCGHADLLRERIDGTTGQ